MHLLTSHGIRAVESGHLHLKCRKEMENYASIHCTSLSALKIILMHGLKSVGRKQFCFQCNCINNEGQCSKKCPNQRNSSSVECYFATKNRVGNRPDSKVYKPLELLDKEHEHHLLVRYREVLAEARRSCAIHGDGDDNAGETTEQPLVKQITLNPDVVLLEVPSMKRRRCKTGLRPVKACTRWKFNSDEIMSKSKDLHRMSGRQHTFRRELNTLKEEDDKFVAFAVAIYEGLCVKFFDGKLSSLAEVYSDKCQSAQTDFESSIVSFAGKLVTILKTILESYVPDKRQRLNQRSSFLEFVSYQSEVKVTQHNDAPSSEQGLSLENNENFKRSFTRSVEDILLYTIRVMEEHKDVHLMKNFQTKWENAVNNDREKVSMVCEYVLHLAKIDPCHREKIGYSFYVTPYGSFVRAKILKFKNQNAEKLLDRESPRKLKREVTNLLLFVRLCSLAWKPKELLPTPIILHEVLPNTHLVQDLEAMLLLLDEFIPKAIKRIQTETIVKHNDNTSEFISTTALSGLTAHFKLPDDFRDACLQIKEDVNDQFIRDVMLPMIETYPTLFTDLEYRNKESMLFQLTNSQEMKFGLDVFCSSQPS